MLNERAVDPAIVVLVDDRESAESIAGMLSDLSSEGNGLDVHIPPVRGIGFFADGTIQHEVDQWWAAHIRSDVTPVYIVDHHPDLAGWLSGVDGRAYVGVTSADSSLAYEGCTNVRVVVVRSALDYAAAVMSDLAAEGRYRQSDVDRVSRLAESLERSNGADLAPTGLRFGKIDDAGPDPFDLLIAMSAESHPEPTAARAPNLHAAATPNNEERRAMRLPAWARLAGTRRHRTDLSDRELADHLVQRGSIIVAVGSRKGGVGKTSHAAGVAIIAGSALDSIGRCAAIVDANLANPDAWGQMNLPAGAATVRDMIAALASNQEPPRPVHASTPALACYPESRETSEYTRTEIGMLVAHLRSRYPLVVVDLSNRLPDPTAGPEATVAAYWLEHADVLVLPSATSKQDFNGVLDYLEVADLPPVIVASLVPRTRRNREHPLAKRYMSAIAQRAYRVVDIPDEAERVRYAGMQGVPVEAVSSALKAAYRELAEAIASAPQAVAR